MKIFRGTHSRWCSEAGCVLAVGNFDGVHLGHRKIFEVAVDKARSRGVAAALLTFSDHPQGVLRPDEAPQPLMVLDDRLAIARQSGFDAAVILDFDSDLASMSPERFADEILSDALGAVGIVAGVNWRFGRGRAGDMEFLRDKDLEVTAVEPVTAGGEDVSSTRIRSYLSEGDVAAARTLLGRPHFVRGNVLRGRGRGKHLGFPTVNLDTGPVMIPATGVYAGGYFLGSVSGPAAVNVGPSPTYEDSVSGVEAYLVNWERNLYGESVAIVFLQRLRPEGIFKDAGPLSRRIAADVEQTRQIFTPDAFAGVPR